MSCQRYIRNDTISLFLGHLFSYNADFSSLHEVSCVDFIPDWSMICCGSLVWVYDSFFGYERTWIQIPDDLFFFQFAINKLHLSIYKINLGNITLNNAMHYTDFGCKKYLDGDKSPDNFWHVMTIVTMKNVMGVIVTNFKDLGYKYNGIMIKLWEILCKICKWHAKFWDNENSFISWL